ncbi:MAG: hypothetical protein WBO69_19495 [Thermoanaerobaculia bacterium]
MTPAPIAYFVSSHGFGHAARSAAVMESIHDRSQETQLSIFTGVPRWFFEDSMTAPFDYVKCHTDVGLVQATPMDEDLPATLGELSNFLPLREESVERAAKDVRSFGCRLVASDISPLGIAVAAKLGLPCALIENFTWDWIYRAYLEDEPRLAFFIDELHRLYSSVPLRIQAQPYCEPVTGAAEVSPISRSVRQSAQEIRTKLQLPGDSSFVLMTMGGFQVSYRFLERLYRYPEVTFVIPGAADRIHRERNLIRLPHRTTFQHADLVAAADMVVGKLGYSTLAEVIQAETPYLFIQRPRFPESPALASYARRRLVCAEITEPELEAAEWPGLLPELKRNRRAPTIEQQGSQQAAGLLLDLLDSR